MLRLNAFQLKSIAVVLMLCDHVAVFLHPILSEPVYYSLRYVGRLAMPLFFFLIVESFYHTRNRIVFLSRLWGFALLMMLGSFMLVNSFDVLLGRVDIFYVESTTIFDRVVYGVGYNILVTLSIVVTFFWCCLRFQHSGILMRTVLIWLIAALFLASFFVEGQFFACGLVTLFFVTHGSRKKQFSFFVCFSLLPLLSAILHRESIWHTGYAWIMIFALPLLLAYNGESGHRSKKQRYFFYIFYIVHLWILYAIVRLMGWR